MLRTIVLLAVASAGAVGFAPRDAAGAVLASYTFGNLGEETTVESSPAFAPSSVAAGLIATPVADPNGTVGIEISSAATTPPGAPFLRLDPQGNSPDPATAVTNNKYYEFSLTANAGNTLNLTNIEFDVMRGGGSTPRGYALRSSLDNYASDLSQADVATARPTYTHIIVPLAALNVPNVTFRMFSYSPAAGNSLDYDNITVNGDVVPEPSALGVLAVAGLTLLARRRGRVTEVTRCW
jgi:hypothetical protein